MNTTFKKMSKEERSEYWKKQNAKRKEYFKNWRLKNRDRLNKYLVSYLNKTGKKYHKKRIGDSLVTIHRKIEKKLGTPSYCEHCKRTDKSKYEWSNKDHKYKLDNKYWQRLCTSCHCIYDRKFNNKKTYLEK